VGEIFLNPGKFKIIVGKFIQTDDGYGKNDKIA
jgi:hypothetical protein